MTVIIAGRFKLYAACGDGHVYQYNYENSQWLANDLGNAQTPLYALGLGDGDNDNQYEIYTIGDNSHAYQFKYASIAPTATPTPTPMPTATPMPDFEGQIISKNYCYAAPNPIRGKIAKIHVYCKQPAQVKMKIFTLISEEVLSLERFYHVGDNVENINMGNLPNGGYYLFIKARSDDGTEEKVKTKIFLLK